MTVLGEGNGTGYPAALDTRETQVDQPAANKTLVDANLLNDILRAIVGIQTELGVDPAGNYDDLISSLNGTGTAVDSSTGATITLPTDGSYVEISGSGNKTDFSAAASGTVVFALFTSAMTLKHNTAKIILANTDKVTANGDLGVFRCLDGSIWRMLYYQPSGGVAPQSEVTSHTGNTSNPHAVDKDDVSLGIGDSPEFTGLTITSTSAFTGAITATGGVELSHATANTLTGSSGDALIEGTILKKVGKDTIWVPVEAMTPATTQPCGDLTLVEAGTNDVDYNVMDFDASSDEYANFNIQMPKSWNLGTVTFQVVWLSTATDTDGIAMGLQGVAISDNEAIDASWGTAVVVTDDAQSAAGEVYVTAESGAVTIAGTPADDDLVIFRLFRDVSDANDDMTEDARVLGIRLFFTTDASEDT